MSLPKAHQPTLQLGHTDRPSQHCRSKLVIWATGVWIQRPQLLHCSAVLAHSAMCAPLRCRAQTHLSIISHLPCFKSGPYAVPEPSTQVIQPSCQRSASRAYKRPSSCQAGAPEARAAAAGWAVKGAQGDVQAHDALAALAAKVVTKLLKHLPAHHRPNTAYAIGGTFASLTAGLLTGCTCISCLISCPIGPQLPIQA